MIGPDVIVERVYARLDQILGNDWNKSLELGESFGREPSSLGHRAYAAHIGDTVTQEKRQRAEVGALSTSTLIVQASWKLRPKERLTSRLEAHRDESLVLGALMGVDPAWPAPIGSISLVKTSRAVSRSGESVTARFEFAVLHTNPLR